MPLGKRARHKFSVAVAATYSLAAVDAANSNEKEPSREGPIFTLSDKRFLTKDEVATTIVGNTIRTKKGSAIFIPGFAYIFLKNGTFLKSSGESRDYGKHTIEDGRVCMLSDLENKSSCVLFVYGKNDAIYMIINSTIILEITASKRE